MLLSVPSKRADIKALAEALASRASRAACDRAALDRRATETLGGVLSPGALHEWFASGSADRRDRRQWSVPLTAVIGVALGVVDAHSKRVCVWIGRRCWPYPPAIGKVSPALLSHCLFVDPTGHEDRVWATELALRSDDVALVVADASRLNLNESRRLQLAAEAGGALGMLLRPPWEMNEFSVARTRWRVSPAVSIDADQQWKVELLRCKGLRPMTGEARLWSVRRSHATGDVRVVPDAEHRSRPTAENPTRHCAV